MEMKNKKAFALRIEEDIFRRVEKLAREEYRSTNGQIEWMLCNQLREMGKLEEKDDNEESEGSS
jgi:hypothetical protein